MARARHLNNAPIVEALIDLRVKLASNFDVEAFALLKDALYDSYPKMEPKRQVEFGLHILGKSQFKQSLQDKGLGGYWFSSADGKNIVQFRKDGFTFSRLQPYTEWDTVCAEAKRLWSLYVDRASPELVSRIAVRYINQLDLPLPILHFGDYLAAPPSVPKALPQTISQFMTRVTMCDELKDISANITQAIQKGSKPDHVSVILDIDVYKTRQRGFEHEEMWRSFEELRELKNRIFFSSIKEKTARLYQ